MWRHITDLRNTSVGVVLLVLSLFAPFSVFNKLRRTVHVPSRVVPIQKKGLSDRKKMERKVKPRKPLPSRGQRVEDTGRG